MELMLIVWLVSILSNIKLFVSTYTVMCVLVVLIVYLMSKLNFHQITKSIRIRSTLPEIREGQTIEVTTSLLEADGLNVPVGTYIVRHLYPSSCRATIKNIEDSHDYYVNLGKLQLQLSPSVVSDEQEKPIAKQYAAPLRTSGYVAIGMIVASVLLPSDTTMKYMAGAYLVQSVYESDLVQSAAPIARDAVNNQLKLWAKDTPDMDVLVRQAEQAAAAVKVVENVGPTSDPSK